MSALSAPFAPRPEWNDPEGVAAIAATGGSVHWLRVRDGLPLRAAYWGARDRRPRGTMLLLNGRAEFIEKHLESVEELRQRGFAVWTLDWRGQGRSGRLLTDPGKGHVRDFADYVADLAQLVREKVEPTLSGGPLLMLAHSMGGNIALRYLAAYPGLVQRAVLSAPMIDFQRNGMPLRRALALTGFLCALPGVAGRYNGRHRRAILAAHADVATNPFTTCPLRFARTAAWLAQDPRLGIGAATWGWSRAALRSVATLAAPEVARRISIPVLLLAAEDERITDNAAIARFAVALPQARLEVIPGTRHELLGEADAPRARFWRAFDAFLEASPAKPPAEAAAFLPSRG
ncbi:MAG: alpha/beta hydrolase [Acetobacteraceae bacterium]|nr:alpha/beta hydrolase [Acetobacteraceae bacterium]